MHSGSAIEALAHMDTFLAKQPKGFPSVPDAIKWQYVLSLHDLILVPGLTAISTVCLPTPYTI